MDAMITQTRNCLTLCDFQNKIRLRLKESAKGKIRTGDAYWGIGNGKKILQIFPDIFLGYNILTQNPSRKNILSQDKAKVSLALERCLIRTKSALKAFFSDYMWFIIRNYHFWALSSTVLKVWKTVTHRQKDVCVWMRRAGARGKGVRAHWNKTECITWIYILNMSFLWACFTFSSLQNQMFFSQGPSIWFKSSSSSFRFKRGINCFITLSKAKKFQELGEHVPSATFVFQLRWARTRTSKAIWSKVIDLYIKTLQPR